MSDNAESRPSAVLAHQTQLRLIDRVPDAGTPDAVLEAFIDHQTDIGIAPYPAQEDAIIELLAGSNVILATPTGSGKSLVAVAAHFSGLASGRRSIYTAPIKALVSEKFFALCEDFGLDKVGMVTGDASVNPHAPIICCTAEILANMVLRRGHRADADIVIMDEFHFYSDPQRGWAWQAPLLELAEAQFLLMSATLGDTSKFERSLTGLTGRHTALVTSADRPVPLRFAYRETSLIASVEELLKQERAPIYVVYFTQREATEAAQGFTSINVMTKAEKRLVADRLKGFRFDSPIGKDLKRYLSHGVGVHHAGLLPKYRRLIERLAQQGLLKLICGTDTLGVGINVPIRSVLLSQLCKFDGDKTRVLKVREFQQIAGRAGRKGFDDVGDVWAQAPPHIVENRKAELKAAQDPKKRKKLVKRKAPEFGYAHWNESIFERLVAGEPETLKSQFAVSHHMMLNVLDRPGDGCKAMRALLTENHDPRVRQRFHIRRSISIFRSLVEAGVVELLNTPDDAGRLVRVTVDLQDDFALTQPLSLFAVEAIAVLEEGDDYALDVLSVIEAVSETPRVIVAAQLNRLRSDRLTEMKMDGLDYEQRMESLEEIEAPEPLTEFLGSAFEIFRRHHPWVGAEAPEPKSIARDMWERAMNFSEFVTFYGLKRSEGVVLRHLGNVYKGLVQNVPLEAKTPEVFELTDWLGELVRQVDSSLIAEWESLSHLVSPSSVPDSQAAQPERSTVTSNHRAFKVMVRNSAFRWITALARRDVDELVKASRPTSSAAPSIDPSSISESIDEYFADHDRVEIDSAARAACHFEFSMDSGRVSQTVVDPQAWHEWRLQGGVDFEASDDQGRAVLQLYTLKNLSRHDHP